MALFKNNKGLFSYDIAREGEDVILMINCENYPKLPSIEDEPVIMTKTCDLLLEVGNVTKIVFYQKRNYEYDYSQVVLLQEIARLYNQIIKNKRLFGYNVLVLDPACTKCI